jgi:hypothetical protein
VLSAARVISGVREDGEHLPRRLVTSDSHILEAGRLAGCGKFFGLAIRPSMGRVTRGSELHSPLDGEQPATGEEHATNLTQAQLDVTPVMHRRQGPDHCRRRVFEGKRLGGTSDKPNMSPARAENAGHATDAQHHGRRIHTDDRRRTGRGGARIATPGPHPMSTTRSPAPTEANLTARSASGCRPTVKLRAAIRPPKPPNPG